MTNSSQSDQPNAWANVPDARRRRVDAGQDPSTQFDLAAAALLSALEHLCCQGSGPQPWIVSFHHDPIAFLLDAMSDAVNVWSAEGRLVYQNPSSAELGLGRFEDTALVTIVNGEIRYQRRCLKFRVPNAEFLLEIIHPLSE